jgi:hypothetical protein
MRKSRLTISKFSDLPGLQEIVGFGKARLPTGDASEVEIEVFFASPNPKRRYDFDEHGSVGSRWIGCGQLAATPIGSRWFEGKHVSDRLLRAGEFDVRFQADQKLGEFIATDKTPFFPTTGFADSPCFYLNVGDPNQVAIVPVVEVIRAVFGVSSGFLRQVFDGVRDPAMVRDRPTFDRVRSHIFGEKNFFLRCFKRPTDAEAIRAAAVLSDDQLRRAHDSVFQNLSVQRNWRNCQPTPIAMLYPFSDVTHWTYEGRWLAIPRRSLPPVKRLLVTRIHALRFPLKFDYVQAEFPEPVVVKGPKRLVGRPTHFEARALKGSTSRAPGLSSPAAKMAVPGARIEGEEKIGLKKWAIDTLARPEIVTMKVDPQHGSSASTGDRRPGGDPKTTALDLVLGAAKAGGGESMGPLLVSMEKTYAAIVELATREGWTILPELGRPDYPWLVQLGLGTAVADVLFVVLKVHGYAIAVVDAGSRGRHKRPVGLLMRRDQGDFDPPHIKEVKMITQRNGGSWEQRAVGDVTRRGQSEFPDYAIVTVRHLLDEPSEKYAKRILAKIKLLIAAAGGAPLIES